MVKLIDGDKRWRQNSANLIVITIDPTCHCADLDATDIVVIEVHTSASELVVQLDGSGRDVLDVVVIQEDFYEAWKFRERTLWEKSKYS